MHKINSQLFLGISSHIFEKLQTVLPRRMQRLNPPPCQTPTSPVVLTFCNQSVIQVLWNKWWQGSSVMISSFTYSLQQIVQRCSWPTLTMKKKHYRLVLHPRGAKIKTHILSTVSLMITKYNHTYSSKV